MIAPREAESGTQGCVCDRGRQPFPSPGRSNAATGWGHWGSLLQGWAGQTSPMSPAHFELPSFWYLFSMLWRRNSRESKIEACQFYLWYHLGARLEDEGVVEVPEGPSEMVMVAISTLAVRVWSESSFRPLMDPSRFPVHFTDSRALLAFTSC